MSAVGVASGHDTREQLDISSVDPGEHATESAAVEPSALLAVSGTFAECGGSEDP